MQQNTSKLNVLLSILNKKTDQRSTSDLDTLIPIIKSIDFFKEKEIKDQDLNEIALCLKYEFHKRNSLVFDFGTTGDKFYIILDGNVSVQIPIKRKKTLATEDEGLFKPSMQPLDINRIGTQPLNTMSHPLNSQRMGQNSPIENQQTIMFGRQATIINKRQLMVKTSMEQNVGGGSEPKSAIHKQAQSRTTERSFDKSSLDHKERSNSILEQIRSFHDHTPSMLKPQKSDEVILEDAQKEGDGAEKTNEHQDQETFEKPVQASVEEQKLALKNLLIKQSAIFKERKVSDAAEEETVYTEVVQLGGGKSFGELALITNKPRAARIRCINECHFAVMTKHEYNRCLAKIENKARLRTISFLSDLPFFCQWSKTQLGKLIQSFNVKKFQRGHILFREGEANDDIFIVRSGEFEGLRTMVIKSQNPKESVKQYLRGERTKMSLRSSINPVMESLTSVSNITNTLRACQQIQLFLFGKGQIFGEERFMRNKGVAPYTAVCSSLEAEVMRISSIEFVRKVINIPETADIIKQNTSYKEDKIAQKQLSGLMNYYLQHHQPDSTESQITELKSQPFTKFLLKSSNEKREALKEIVEGYPGVKRVSKLITNPQLPSSGGTYSATYELPSSDNKPKTMERTSIQSKLNNSFEVGLTTPIAGTRFQSTKGSMRVSQDYGSSNFRVFSAEVSPMNPVNTRVSTTITQRQSPATQSNQMSFFGRSKRYKNKSDVPRGVKVYLSSKLVNAVEEMQQHQQNLHSKRSEAKQSLQMKKQKQIIDETTIQLQNTNETQSNRSQEESNQDDLSPARSMRSEFSRYQISQSVVLGETNRKPTLIESAMPSVLLDKLISYQGSQTHQNSPTAGGKDSIFEFDGKTSTNFFSRQTSKKSFKSIAVDQRNKKQSISVNKDEIVSLPNKSFFNGNGSQIKMLGSNPQQFSPLIQYLLKQRNQQVQRSRKRSLVESVQAERQSKGIDRTVFMQVAQTLQRGNVVSLKKNSQAFNRHNQFLPSLHQYQ